LFQSNDHSDSHVSELSSKRPRRITTSSKQSDSDYQTFASALNKQSYSTPEPYNYVQTTSGYSSTYENEPIQPSRNTSTTVLTNLLQRYERTLQQRQTPIVVVNDRSLDVQNLIQKYKDKVEQADRVNSTFFFALIYSFFLLKELEIYRNLLNKKTEHEEEEEKQQQRSTPRLIQRKYRTLPEITSEQMIQNYVPIRHELCSTPSPRISVRSPRPTRFDYCDLCLNDQDSTSAWIRYNEQRIDQLQKRIDLMLQIDDYEENFFYPIPETTVSQPTNKFKQRARTNSYFDRQVLSLVSPRRYNFRFAYRTNPSSPRLLTRNLTRSANSLGKSVRICTEPAAGESFRIRRTSKTFPRPIVSILRRSATTTTSSIRSQSTIEPSSHTWTNESDGKVYVLQQFSIPRYYRLYNDVSFREVYYFSCLLDKYINRTTPSNYSNIVRNYAIQQQLPTLSSAA